MEASTRKWGQVDGSGCKWGEVGVKCGKWGPIGASGVQKCASWVKCMQVWVSVGGIGRKWGVVEASGVKLVQVLCPGWQAGEVAGSRSKCSEIGQSGVQLVASGGQVGLSWKHSGAILTGVRKGVQVGCREGQVG